MSHVKKKAWTFLYSFHKYADNNYSFGTDVYRKLSLMTLTLIVIFCYKF